MMNFFFFKKKNLCRDAFQEIAIPKSFAEKGLENAVGFSEAVAMHGHVYNYMSATIYNHLSLYSALDTMRNSFHFLREQTANCVARQRIPT